MSGNIFFLFLSFYLSLYLSFFLLCGRPLFLSPLYWPCYIFYSIRIIYIQAANWINFNELFLSFKDWICFNGMEWMQTHSNAPRLNQIRFCVSPSNLSLSKSTMVKRISVVVNIIHCYRLYWSIVLLFFAKNWKKQISW